MQQDVLLILPSLGPKSRDHVGNMEFLVLCGIEGIVYSSTIDLVAANRIIIAENPYRKA